MVVPQGPAGERGSATLWPWDTPLPSASWINYLAGAQNIANAGTVQTTATDATNPDISVRATRDIHLVIDVLGYYSR